MEYLTILRSNDDKVVTIAGGADNAVFPATKLGIDALKIYAFEYTIFGELIESGEAGLYVTEAGSPIELPFDMNLNYVDLKNARKLSAQDLDKAIQIMSQYNSGDIINSAYVDLEANQERESAFAFEMNHNRDQLIHILSSIAVTMGSVITSEKDRRGQSAMANQVLITRPTTFIRISQEQAVALLSGKQSTFDSLSNQDEDDGEFGMGGDWWKNLKEAIIKIAQTIDEDLI